MPLSQQQAEAFAAQVLQWLSSDAARIGGFLGASGLGPAELRQLAGQPEFLLAVLDFLMADEPQLLACCADLDVPPQRPAEARAALPGGDEWHWT
ncbi:MAG: DUF3572 domain-containing protein [Pararhodobacter sp.]|nr:DUF3572 domain-containing protein [Pararhodobacter sp.]